MFLQYRQREILKAISAQAKANGVTDLEEVDRQTAQILEPELTCEEALLSPSTGIIDSHRCY